MQPPMIKDQMPLLRTLLHRAAPAGTALPNMITPIFFGIDRGQEWLSRPDHRYGDDLTTDPICTEVRVLARRRRGRSHTLRHRHDNIKIADIRLFDGQVDDGHAVPFLNDVAREVAVDLVIG